MDLIGGGRRGRSFTLEGRGGRGGSEEEVGLLLVSALVWTFLRAGAGVWFWFWFGVGGLAGPGGLGAGTGAAEGLTGSGCVGESPVGLGARLGALDLRAEFREDGLVGTKGRTPPGLTVWFVVFCVASVPAGVSLGAPPPTSTEGLGGRVGVVCPSAVLLSGAGAPTLALGATGGLGGTLESVREEEEESLGGGGLGAGTGAGAGDSGTDEGFGLMEGFSGVLQV